jgi:hypothetical protein
VIGSSGSLLGIRPGALRFPCPHPVISLCSAGVRLICLVVCDRASPLLWLCHLTCLPLGLRGECAPSVGLLRPFLTDDMLLSYLSSYSRGECTVGTETFRDGAFEARNAYLATSIKGKFKYLCLLS